MFLHTPARGAAERARSPTPRGPPDSLPLDDTNPVAAPPPTPGRSASAPRRPPPLRDGRLRSATAPPAPRRPPPLRDGRLRSAAAAYAPRGRLRSAGAPQLRGHRLRPRGCHHVAAVRTRDGRPLR